MMGNCGGVVRGGAEGVSNDDGSFGFIFYLFVYSLLSVSVSVSVSGVYSSVSVSLSVWSFVYFRVFLKKNMQH